MTWNCGLANMELILVKLEIGDLHVKMKLDNLGRTQDRLNMTS